MIADASNGKETRPSKPDSLDELTSSLSTMKREIDGLQILATNQRKPWYRDLSTIIAFLAFIFSFGTTVVSYHRTQLQDIQSSRQELRGLLQRLSAIPRDNFEANKRYDNDPSAKSSMGQLYAQENALLSRQAAEIVQKLPSQVVSATEYYEVAVALESAYNLNQAKEFLRLARQRSTDFNDEVAAIRSSAALEYLMGASGTGRQLYQEALDIFAKYPFDQYTKDSTNIFTEIQWAKSEAGQGQFTLANQHLDNAAHIAERMPYSPGAEGLKMQIAQTRTMMAGGMAHAPELFSPSSLSSQSGK